jgi:hypothetical protein
MVGSDVMDVIMQIEHNYNKMYKIKLTYYDLENNISIESINAEKVNNYYRVKNSPFFAPNLAYDDLISVENDDGELFFDDIIEVSGNSTIQIIIYNKNDIFSITKEIEELNCGWEGSHLLGYISVNVPKEVNYLSLKSLLDSYFQDKVLDYKEACLAHNI